ncbi:hypothetical protein OQA88_12052 [Cercophora sp. LCS_1]
MAGTFASAFFLTMVLVAGAVVEFDLHRGIPGVRFGALPPISRPLSRRATYTQQLANNITGGGYFCNVQVGNPGQPVTMVLDTGSSDAWVIKPTADLCVTPSLQQKYSDSCGNTYNYSESGSYKMVERGGFEIKYLDGSTARGDYISDDFTIAGTTIKSLQMGYVNQTVRGTGILGIGYSTRVTADTPYPNIVDQFVDQGIIEVRAYSLYLNDRRSPTGSILFGGIDTEKFIGPLSVLPILRPAGQKEYTSFEITFTGLGVTYTDGSSVSLSASHFQSRIVPAVLDSGSTLSYLPDQLARAIYRELDATYDTEETGLAFIDCAHLSDDPHMVITFTFDSVTISVPVNEMVLDILGPFSHLLPANIPYKNTCLFGIQNTAGFGTIRQDETDFALLGDTFLRSAYVVYDLEHHEIGIAQANRNSTKSAIVELKAGESSLPSVTGVARPDSTTRDGVETVTVTATNAAPTRLSSGGEALVAAGLTIFGVLAPL